MASTFNDSSLSSDQDTNQFLVYTEIKLQISYLVFLYSYYMPRFTHAND